MLVAVVLFIALLNLTIVRGESMEPAFHDGDIVACEKTDKLYVDDIIVYKSGRIHCIKRIVAVGGDIVSYDNGKIYVNGIDLGYKTYIENAGILADGRYKVPDNEFFCIGDNINYSEDSRKIGAVSQDMIKCRVKKILFHI